MNVAALIACAALLGGCGTSLLVPEPGGNQPLVHGADVLCVLAVCVMTLDEPGARPVQEAAQ